MTVSLFFISSILPCVKTFPSAMTTTQSQSSLIKSQDGGRGASITTSGQVRHMALADYKNKKGLLASIIGVFCDCEYITDDDGFDSKLNFRLPFYTLLGTVLRSPLQFNH